MLDAIRHIAEDLITVMRAVMDSDTGINVKAGKNTLTNSDIYNTLNSAVQIAGDDIVVSLFINHYADYIESGRRKGATPPPFNAIAEWARRKGISTDNRVIWAIRQAIVRDGIAPRPIISVFFERIDNLFETDYFDRIFDEITKILDNYFNS